MQLALTVGGAYLGSLIPGLPPNVGQALGATAGSLAGAYLFGPELPDIQGPRLEDLKVQVSTNGMPIPIVYGAYRLAGNVIYATDILETRTDEEVGGKGGSSATKTTFTYSVSLAVGVCEGPIDGIRRIWANGKLVYNADTGLMDTDIGDMRIYLGTENQTADPFWQGIYGSDNVPAHRGLVYVAFDNLQLAAFGNRIPNFSFEVYPTFQNAIFSFISIIDESIVYEGNFFITATKIYNSHIYSVGYVSAIDSDFDHFLIKQDLNGNIISAKRYKHENQFSDSFWPTFLEIKNNNIYIYSQECLFKFDLDFNSIYLKQFKINNIVNNYSLLNVDNNENVYFLACPEIYTSNFSLTKFDSNGNFVWEKYFEKFDISIFSGIDFCNDGKIVLLSQTGYVIKLNTNGEIEFSFKLSNEIYYEYYIYASFLKVDANNNIYICGVNPTEYIEEEEVWKNYIPFVLKLGQTGNLLWAKNIDYYENIEYLSSAERSEHLINIDQSGNIYFLSQFDNYELTSNRLIVKLNSSGNIVWSKTFNNLFGAQWWINYLNTTISIGENYLSLVGLAKKYDVSKYIDSVVIVPLSGTNEFFGDDFSVENIEFDFYSSNLFNLTSSEIIENASEIDVTVESWSVDIIDLQLEAIENQIIN